jgi:hypothetical protein
MINITVPLAVLKDCRILSPIGMAASCLTGLQCFQEETELTELVLLWCLAHVE